MAVAGHLEETSGGAAREPRRKLLLEAAGATAAGEATGVLVHNISATGLLLESPVALAVGAVAVGLDVGCWGEDSVGSGPEHAERLSAMAPTMESTASRRRMVTASRYLRRLSGSPGP